MKAIRQKYDDQIQRLNAVWDRFANLKPGDMEGDVDLWNEMRDRYGDYFEGCMGAEAIKKRLEMNLLLPMKTVWRLSRMCLSEPATHWRRWIPPFAM